MPRVLPVHALPTSGDCTIELYSDGRCPPETVYQRRYAHLSALMSMLASRSALLISRQSGANAIETINRLNDATENFNFASKWAEGTPQELCFIDNPTCRDGLTREHADLVFSYFDRAERKIRAYLEVVDELLATPAGPMTVAANAFRAKSIEEGLDSMPSVPPPPPRQRVPSSSSSSSTTTTTQASGRVTFWIAAGALGLGAFAIYRLNARVQRRRGGALGANGNLPPVIGRGFKGKMDWAQFEHDEAFRLIDDAIDYKIAGDVVPSAENLLMAHGFASSAGMLATLASDGARTEDQKRRASKLHRSLLSLADKSERGILSIIKECDQKLGPYQPPPTVNGLGVRRARLAR